MQKLDRAHELATKLESECLGVRVGRLQRLVSRHYSQALRPHRLTNPQLEMLAILVLHGTPMKPAALAAELGIERSTMSRNLALLEKSGWISVTEVSATGRFMSVAITAAGRKKLVDARAAWTTAQAAVRKVLGADATRTLDTWLEKLR